MYVLASSMFAEIGDTGSDRIPPGWIVIGWLFKKNRNRNLHTYGHFKSSAPGIKQNAKAVRIVLL
jgi:hypothetical protein